MLTILLKYWKFAALGLMAIVLAIGFFYVKNLKTENARLSEGLQTRDAAIGRLASDLEANRRALAARQAEAAALAEERDQATKALEEIYKNDKDACGWRDTAIPGGIYDRLCQ